MKVRSPCQSLPFPSFDPNSKLLFEDLKNLEEEEEKSERTHQTLTKI